ncbi:hypothetical protein J6590_020518 [Homalodisca vitripennis]|nr:hypothetical protein J6590_020518 [Homalodisca vitripennis]
MVMKLLSTLTGKSNGTMFVYGTLIIRGKQLGMNVTRLRVRWKLEKFTEVINPHLENQEWKKQLAEYIDKKAKELKKDFLKALKTFQMARQQGDKSIMMHKKKLYSLRLREIRKEKGTNSTLSDVLLEGKWREDAACKQLKIKTVIAIYIQEVTLLVDKIGLPEKSETRGTTQEFIKNPSLKTQNRFVRKEANLYQNTTFQPPTR